MIAPPSIFDVTDGGDHDAGDVEGNHRLLSVAEIQQVVRELRARGARAVAAETGATSQHPQPGNSEQRAFEGERVPAARRPRGARASTPAQDRGDTEQGELGSWGDIAAGIGERADRGAQVEAGWIGVLAAHGGAGASTVALTLGDAAAAVGWRVHLVDTAHPRRSGLLAATSEELGPDVTGAWRRGLRARVTIDRRTTHTAPDGWPVPPVGDDPTLTVVDLGLTAPEDLTRLAAGRSHPVIVCRPTVPGVRLTEQLLEQLAEQPVVVAAIGPARWSGQVIASLGPRLRSLRAAGCVASVPMDRRLQIAGLTSAPLPRPLRMAGRALLELLDDGQRGSVAHSSAAANHPVPTPEETHR